jgi:hypothetical protein
MSDADAAQLLPPPLIGRFQCDGSSEFCSHPLMTWYRSAFDRKRYLAAFAMAKAAVWSCVLRFDAGRANHSRMIAFHASACVIAVDLQAWPRLRNLPRAQRTIAHDYRPEADALSSASGFGQKGQRTDLGTPAALSRKAAADAAGPAMTFGAPPDALKPPGSSR